MYELALFAGAGGGILGGHLCGFTCLGAVEIEPYPRKVLLQRQRDGILPNFPIWDDVATFSIDNPETREFIEQLRTIDRLVISGGFPCQDISVAGKGAGIDEDTRSGLWYQFERIIREIRPSHVFVENSPALTIRGLGIVLGGLAEMGYNAKWGVLGAVDVGAPHKRERIWIVAHSESVGDRRRSSKISCEDEFAPQERPKKRFQQSNYASEGDREEVADTGNDRDEQWVRELRENKSDSGHRADNRGGTPVNEVREWWTIEPELGRVAHGVANRVDRLKAIGNGQVPAVAYAAWIILNQKEQ